MQPPTIKVKRTTSIYFSATAPCGRSWPGMTTSTNDVSTIVLRAIEHADTCPQCQVATVEGV